MKKYLLLSLFPFLLFSCEKELDFKYNDVESQFVIEGTLSDKEINVLLSYTVPMNEPIISDFILDADVTLTDKTDKNSYSLIPKNGIFYSEVTGIPGHEYELTVNHRGRTFTSTCLMRSGIKILDLKFQWIKMPYDKVAVLEIISTVLEKEGTCYWTRIYKNGEPYKWLMSHGSGSIDGKLSQTTFTTRLNPEEDDKDTLKEDDELTVSVWPISLDMYDYLVGISSDSNGPAMFSGDFCLGYFLAAEPAVSTIIFKPEEIPNYSSNN